MAVIYLRHPAHGAKVATLEAEAIYDESNGWMRYDPTTPVAADDDEGDAPVNEMAVPKRRGRPRATQDS